MSTYTVTALTDTGAGGELRGAIISANSDPGSTINFSVSGTITLTADLIGITAPMTIDGTGETVAVDGYGQVYHIFYVSPGSGNTVTLNNLTIQNGYRGSPLPGNGGAVYAATGNVIVNNCTMTGNTSGTRSGGAMHCDGVDTFVITNCTVYDNHSGSGGGGGINISGGVVTILNCTFFGNSGNGNGDDVRIQGGTVTIKNSILYSTTYGNPVQDGSPTITYSDVYNGFSGTGNISGDPLLGSLANNGGNTHTSALGTGSPAIHAGTHTGAPTNDQTGMAFANPPSMGAKEFVSPDTTPPVVSSASINSSGTTLTINWTETGSAPVLPSSGGTGLAIGGLVHGTATLSSVNTSGTTTTATISRAIYSDETLTLSGTSTNFEDSASNPVADFSGHAITNNSTLNYVSVAIRLNGANQVSGSQASGSSCTSATLTWDINDLIIVTTHTFDGSGGTNAVTGVTATGLTFVAATDGVHTANIDSHTAYDDIYHRSTIQVFWAYALASGSSTIVATYGSALCGGNMMAFAFVGADPDAPIDQVACSVGYEYGGTPVGQPITTGTDNTTVLSIMGAVYFAPPV